MTTDVEGRITFLNPTASDLTGWELKEAVGQPARSVFRIINEESRVSAEDIAEHNREPTLEISACSRQLVTVSNKGQISAPGQQVERIDILPDP
jgi:PAS domain S-box-containing protein